MSDVRKCDNCTNLNDARTGEWYILEWHSLWAMPMGHPTKDGPWHFDTLECLAQWAELRVAEQHR